LKISELAIAAAIREHRKHFGEGPRKRVQITITLDPGLLRALDNEAKSKRMTRATLLRLMVRGYLAYNSVDNTAP
jgi:hypothetical protein